jgi:hypothetical protein
MFSLSGDQLIKRSPLRNQMQPLGKLDRRRVLDADFQINKPYARTLRGRDGSGLFRVVRFEIGDSSQVRLSLRFHAALSVLDDLRCDDLRCGG